MLTTAIMPTTKKTLENSTGRVREDKRGFVILLFITLLTSLILPVQNAQAQFQQGQLQYSQQFRLGETIIRVAEAGQLADTVHVWGDVNVAGVYVVPRGASLAQVISYSRGPSRYFTSETVLDWSKLRIEVTVSSQEDGRTGGNTYTFRYNEPLPSAMTEYVIQNNDVVMVELKRKPAFVDWVRVIAPAVSTVATTLLIIQNLKQ
jgi:hypothetical protein